jgi:hypothetical protein
MMLDKTFGIPYSRVGAAWGGAPKAGAAGARAPGPDPYLNFYPDPLEPHQYDSFWAGLAS